MNIQGKHTILENRPIAEDIFLLRLSGDTGELKRPGQFVNIKLSGLYLRRPLSVCDWDEDGMTLIYKVVGEGTKQLSKMQTGHTLDLLTGLGNGFDMEAVSGGCVLVGGGVGVPPLYGLAKRLIERGRDITVALGFNTALQAFYLDEFRELGAKTMATTLDGSLGQKGLVTDALKELDYDYYFTCGPMPMLRAVHALGKSGQLSLEERMGCGFGACMGCSIMTRNGPKRVCADGPVFFSQEVIFDD